MAKLEQYGKNHASFITNDVSVPISVTMEVFALVIQCHSTNTRRDTRMDNTPVVAQPEKLTDNQNPKKSSTAKTVFITVACTLLLVGGVYWLFNYYLFPKHFNPVELSEKETRKLNDKLQRVNLPPVTHASSSQSSQSNISQRHPPSPPNDGPDIVDSKLVPEAYSERNAKREVRFSEREVNAVLAHNTNLADKLAIDLSNDLISVKWLLPLDPEFPLLGGKTLKLTAGVEVAYHDSQPVINLRGVSLWGVPMPDAWLGNMKQVNLVTHQQGGNNGSNTPGFWLAFANGIEYLQVSDGEMVIKLKP